jgi:hypothetical protein
VGRAGFDAGAGSFPLAWFLGVSPSGKAAGFDPAIRRFESFHPSHIPALDEVVRGAGATAAMTAEIAMAAELRRSGLPNSRTHPADHMAARWYLFLLPRDFVVILPPRSILQATRTSDPCVGNIAIKEQEGEHCAARFRLWRGSQIPQLCLSRSGRNP